MYTKQQTDAICVHFNYKIFPIFSHNFSRTNARYEVYNTPVGVELEISAQNTKSGVADIHIIYRFLINEFFSFLFKFEIEIMLKWGK